MGETMDSDIRQDWKRLVRAYVQAYWDDARANRNRVLSGYESQFIKEFGAEHLWLDFQSHAKANLDSLRRRPKTYTK